ncbi:Uu.00g116470.m01.CDS01 [Anthostomella pinea]|uniref:Uu.00g116470.m01.CDS01 n=1 Tax=Anthostomella pinea TaxID=933095 RepID=A0AAI8VFY0_9PEZI|nr:Uu.00g116470.m01.CDS01 [Anthostomella pinea]
MGTPTPHSGFITTPGGARLRYTQEGPSSAPNLLLIPGWAQTAAQFKKQVDHFSANFRVTTYDHRGQGESDKPAFGYRIYRLAADLEALLTQLDLRDVIMLGHSMGCSVIWAYWDIFPHDRISKLVLVDQAPILTANPAWSAEEAAGYAAIFSPAAVFEFTNSLAGPDGKAACAALVKSFFTAQVDPTDLDWMLERTLKMPLAAAAQLFINHAGMDWRDVIPRIDVPTLVVAAEGSLLPTKGLAWIAQKIPGAKVEVFKKEDGGSHFMLWENANEFNKRVAAFLTDEGTEESR